MYLTVQNKEKQVPTQWNKAKLYLATQMQEDSLTHTQHNTYKTIPNPVVGVRRSQSQNSLPKRDQQ